MSQAAEETGRVLDDAATKSNDPIIVLKNIVKKYLLGTQDITALDGVTVEFRKGEFITIQGQSGCGKTTLLNMAGLMDRPTSGDVVIMGKSTKDLTDKEQASIRANHVGFVFQFYNLIEHLTALENVTIALAAKGIKKEKERNEIATKVLVRVGLGDRLKNKPDELSGGERQRVAIARALVNGPSIVIADEPTGDLDTETGAEILGLFKDLNEKDGHTILIVTHDPTIGAMGKRKIRMKNYKIIQDEVI
jgi:putative ABC transport system ATP-binding protein